MADASDIDAAAVADSQELDKHVHEFCASDELEERAKDAKPFSSSVRDDVLPLWRPHEIQIFIDVWNLYAFVNSQLIHNNKSYAYFLPPPTTLIETALGLAGLDVNCVFSYKQSSGIGNDMYRFPSPTTFVMNRSTCYVASNDDPLQFMLIETTFISLFHELEIVKENLELQAMFKNGTGGSFKTIYVRYCRHADIPLTGFIHKSKGEVISSNKQWAEVCSRSSFQGLDLGFTVKVKISDAPTDDPDYRAVLAFLSFLGLFAISHLLRRMRMLTIYEAKFKHSAFNMTSLEVTAPSHA
ncbi:hypothetical protein EV360DRAFT_65844 [Lentinula raphanica]|nr:hypothetical protein EV360DRAFT_65844 [Lentinula raphanica]